MQPPQHSVFRDGKYLVVPIQDPVFPSRCVITNEPAEGTHRFVADLFPNMIIRPTESDASAGKTAAKVVGAIAFGRAGSNAVEGASNILRKQRLEFAIGASESVKSSARKIKLVGTLMMILGPLLGVATPGIVYALTGEEPHAAVFIAPMAMGIVCLFAGVFVFFFAPPRLSVLRSDGVCVWLTGAGAQFLDELPQSHFRWDDAAREFLPRSK